MPNDENKVRPGFHKCFNLQRFTGEQKNILRTLSREWYLTNSGDKITIASSEYDYFLMKPTNIFSEMFNIERELICVFADYERFEPRTLDVFDVIQKTKLSQLRVETICRVLFSKDRATEDHIASYIKTNPEQPVVVPFYYGEVADNHDDFYIRNVFAKHFYSRDLFSFFSPLKKELYFFGRSQLVQDLINRHLSGEHTGLFGIRKSGKTSIIFALERALEYQEKPFISIDCESPSVHMLRWNELLYKLINLIYEKMNCKCSFDSKGYSEKFAADSFEKDFLSVITKKKVSNPVLLIFDEIERITPCTASSEHWRTGNDFCYFWQSLRSFFQRNQGLISYLLVGTNPSCTELSTINDHENPIFSSIPPQYVPTFDVPQVREMVRKLGRYMGVRFDETIYALLTNDLGGHPLLIRKACSDMINSHGGKRPFTIDISVYDHCMKNFSDNNSDYLEMITQVLSDWYPEEYDLLCFLANEENELFSRYVSEAPRAIQHLVGYGLVSPGVRNYIFKIKSLKEYLHRKHKYERVNLTQPEKREEISTRRNKIEQALRGILWRALKIHYGRKTAFEKILSSLPEKRRSEIRNQEELLSPGRSPLFFLDLINIINREWESFKNIWDAEKSKILFVLNEVNSSARPDAHAKDISDDDFLQVRLHLKFIENKIDDWL